MNDHIDLAGELLDGRSRIHQSRIDATATAKFMQILGVLADDTRFNLRQACGERLPLEV